VYFEVTEFSASVTENPHLKLTFKKRGYQIDKMVLRPTIEAEPDLPEGMRRTEALPRELKIEAENVTNLLRDYKDKKVPLEKGHKDKESYDSIWIEGVEYEWLEKKHEKADDAAQELLDEEAEHRDDYYSGVERYPRFIEIEGATFKRKQPPKGSPVILHKGNLYVRQGLDKLPREREHYEEQLERFRKMKRVELTAEPDEDITVGKLIYTPIKKWKPPGT